MHICIFSHNFKEFMNILEALIKKIFLIEKNTCSRFLKVGNHLTFSLEGTWNCCSDWKGLTDLAFDRLWFHPVLPCFRRHAESLARARLFSVCMEPQGAVRFQTKSRTEWQEGLDCRAAGRYSSAQVQITFPVQV